MVGIKEETKSLPFYGEIEREPPRGAKGASGVQMVKMWSKHSERLSKTEGPWKEIESPGRKRCHRPERRKGR
jgi:hypothetical protein